MNDKRLIETAFPLAEASAASLHEKNMRHGHISTLHLWPARRPLAASRAAIVAALLPDPGNDAERAQLVRRLGGKLVPKKKGRKENGDSVEAEKVEAEGGILWWGHKSSPDLAWFRDRICAAYGGRAPRVLDPFAGGGAIPLEAMRLGCEVVANDLNPVAWFILKCTLEYPQRLAGQTHPLPMHALLDPAFATAFFKARGLKGAKLTNAAERMLAAGRGEATPDGWLNDRPWEQADFAWHVRAWGNWVLSEARRELAGRYPTYAEWQALHPDAEVEAQRLRLLEPDADGIVSVELLNADIPKTKLDDRRTPRWVAKPTVAYLWARTVPCKSCRATIPLLKTRWLCRKDGKRVLLEMKPNDALDGVIFIVHRNVPLSVGSAAQRRAADAALGAGTMSRSGVKCPCCPQINGSADIRYLAMQGQLHTVMTAVVTDGPSGKEYRLPTRHELIAAEVAGAELDAVARDIPFGLPLEPTPKSGSGASRAFSVGGYGMLRWADVFTARQLVTLSTFVRTVRSVAPAMIDCRYPNEWREAVWASLALGVDRIADRSSSIAHWDVGYEKIANTFSGFRLPMSWDFAESCPTGDSTGSFPGQIEWIAKVIEHTA